MFSRFLFGHRSWTLDDCGKSVAVKNSFPSKYFKNWDHMRSFVVSTFYRLYIKGWTQLVLWQFGAKFRRLRDVNLTRSQPYKKARLLNTGDGFVRERCQLKCLVKCFKWLPPLYSIVFSSRYCTWDQKELNITHSFPCLTAQRTK